MTLLGRLTRSWRNTHLKVLPTFPSAQELTLRRAGPGQVDGLIVGFCTPDPLYQAEARRMRRSAEIIGLKVEIVQVENAGSWVRNAGLKPRVLAALRERHRGPLLYVDVDAVFHRNPWPDLRTFHDADMGVFHTAWGTLLSGTILLGDTAVTRDLLADWVRACETQPEEWDQRLLSEVLARRPSDIAALPPEYCCIFDDEHRDPIPGVVIEHLQASRFHRDEGRFTRSRRLRRRIERSAAIERILAVAEKRAPSPA